ncbi:UDP-N-acetylglucosamine 1-carboxyvinyltransferase [Candidatus Peregrinibacteria bacterium HGW-Peregrinibacteria-1]|jgi:UDP-N-acetylglucosamine 1-carboxyvinyltransferase|nr:MAG: UDP-N-acetylglucosamine 1-carboxyvinyltransferase [Candidatus Peregrinibacteria bacterium HGW-Peregrinibacteria-1]
MVKFIVNGGRKLKGEVSVNGSKNAVLPIMCAALLTDEKTILTNVPNIADVHSLASIIEELGVRVMFENNRLEIDPSAMGKGHHDLFDDKIKRMRASILLMGPLLARCGEVKMDFPGGCVLGKRSVESHTEALKGLGGVVVEETKHIHMKTDGGLKGGTFVMSEMSVTASENAIMGAVLAEGESEIRMVAAEPHVQDLCLFLQSMGAEISGVGTNFLKIKGVKALKGVTHRVIGDYLEAGTLAIAAVATKGDVKITGIDPGQLDSLWQKLKEMGVELELGDDWIRVKPVDELKPLSVVKTAVYPGFATDLQAPFTVLLTQAEGVSKVFETLFEGRLNYIFELEKMGARVELLNSHQALILGPRELKAVPISSWDIRAGAAMVIAALIAKGATEISNVVYIDRGYENIEKKLNSLGADIKRVDS